MRVVAQSGHTALRHLDAIAGGKSPEYMRTAQAAIAAALPHGTLETLRGQTHMVKAKATAPALAEFLA